MAAESTDWTIAGIQLKKETSSGWVLIAHNGLVQSAAATHVI